jgi:alkylhydroperoxidase family enzyme
MTVAHLDHAKNFHGVADVFLRTPGPYTPLLQFIEQVMTGESQLTKAQREIVAAHVSALNQCDFCLGANRVPTWRASASRCAPFLNSPPN